MDPPTLIRRTHSFPILGINVYMFACQLELRNKLFKPKTNVFHPYICSILLYQLQKCTNYETCAILHRYHILYILRSCTYFVQFCTGFLFFTFCAIVHILCNFAQVSYFVHFAQLYTFLCNFAQVSYFVQLYTFCATLHRFHILYILRSCTRLTSSAGLYLRDTLLTVINLY